MHEGVVYVPGLKWKTAEQDALSQLAPEVADRILPLVELQPPTWDHTREEYKTSFLEHSQRSLDAVRERWGARPFLLDLEDQEEQLGETYVRDVLAAARFRGVSPIPVLRMRRPEEENRAAAAAASEGCALRVTPADLEAENLRASILAFVEEMDVQVRDVDLVLDLGPCADTALGNLRAGAGQMLAEVPEPKMWRSLTLLCSDFPRALDPKERYVQERTERLAWRLRGWLEQRRTNFPRLPMYADHGIQFPVMPELVIRNPDAAANVRYTTSDAYVWAKGESIRLYTGQQYHRLAADLVASQAFRGPDHCAGCAGMAACAAGESGFNAPVAWRRLGTIHHITCVVESLAQRHVA